MTNLMLEVAISSLAIYLFLVLMIRLIGRRTLAQLSAIDLIVIILLGSAVETAMVHASTSFKVGIASALTLLIANRILTFVMLKSKKLRHLVGGGPVLLVHNGEFVHARLKQRGFTEANVREALRAREIGCLEDVKFAVLEPDGRINVVHEHRYREEQDILCGPPIAPASE